MEKRTQDDFASAAFADIVKLISATDADGALARLRSYGMARYNDGYVDGSEDGR